MEFIERTASTTAPTRGVIFLSHATPEENAFARWLTAQLVSAGFEVWCDLTKLLGGERFWKDIEEAIGDHTFRFLFVASLHTHQKPGAQRELRLAFEAQERLGISNFIIPLKIDAFPFESMDRRLPTLNIMRFDEGWSAALSRLLKLLEREDAPKSLMATPACVTEWHYRSLEARRRVQIGIDKAYSNWFPVSVPHSLWMHDLGVGDQALEHVISGFKLPHRIHSDRLLTFAPAHEIHELLAPTVNVRASTELITTEFIGNGYAPLSIASNDASNIITDLLNKAWERTLRDREMCSFEMANHQLAWFYKNGQLKKNRANFSSPSTGKNTYRQLVGTKSKKMLDGGKLPDGFWHYAISGSTQLHPFPRMIIRHHVIFTDDGVKPWESAERMHKARRSVCKQWWNAAWRDRLFAIAALLGDEKETLVLAVANQVSFDVSMRAIVFESPRRFFEDNEQGIEESIEVELIEDPDEHDPEPELSE